MKTQSRTTAQPHWEGRGGPSRDAAEVVACMAGTAAETLAVWWDDIADGAENMAADELLADEAARLGRPLARFYGWTCPTVSLGGFQSIGEARGIDAIAGAALVRRPSGGGAIVHGTDLTYALAVPRDHPLAHGALPLYGLVHRALVDVLADFGLAARLHADGGVARHAGRAGAAEPFFCFSRRAVGDVVATPAGRLASDDDPKMLGSAQRRLPAAILQHGSLLFAANEAVGAAGRHTGLGDLLPSLTNRPREIAVDWVAGIATALGLHADWQPQAFTFGRHESLTARVARFRGNAWLERR
jgi:lipoate-protein ligase A